VCGAAALAAALQDGKNSAFLKTGLSPTQLQALHMPKLDDTHLFDRIQRRLEQLEKDEKVADSDIRAVLSAKQQQQLDAAWSHQQQLRREKRARTQAQQQELGWKTKREVRIEVLKAALDKAREGGLAAVEERMKQQELRQMRIYMRALSQAEKNGKDNQAAKQFANNELTRAGLRRMDGTRVNTAAQRDEEVVKMEIELKFKLGVEWDEWETEQAKRLKLKAGTEGREE
jgi:hypothetical protein